MLSGLRLRRIGYAMTGWVNDISIETTKSLTTTGGTVWDAARRCATYLEAEATRIGLDQPGVRVLELGAGCGLLGLLLARNTPAAAEVCLTEQAYGGALDHLLLNVNANRHLPNMGAVTACSCDWTHFMDEQLVKTVRSSSSSREVTSKSGAVVGGVIHTSSSPEQQQQQQQCGGGPVRQQPDAQAGSEQSSSSCTSGAELADMQKLLHTHWDIIIGSDLVYNTAGVKGFPRVLAALMHHPGNSNSSSGGSNSCDSGRAHRSRPVMYYAHTKHRFDAMDVDMFAELEGLGLSVEEVVEQGQELPPPSPPPFSSLYPDMRSAVFRITRPAL